MVVDSNNVVLINNFSYKNNFKVGGDNYYYNSMVFIVFDGLKVIIDGKVYINLFVEMDISGLEIVLIVNNGLYVIGMGLIIIVNNGDVYINIYVKNFLELLGENVFYIGGGVKSDVVSGKYGG